MSVNYFIPDLETDPVLFYLTNGDITKIETVNNMDYEKVISWYYAKKVKELNELRYHIALKEFYKK